MLIPLIFIALATLASAVMAYGTHPAWAHFSHGLQFIMLSKRLEWPLAALAMILCLILIGLVISGRRSAWWLIGLAPVLALFGHRFSTGPLNRFNVVDSPAFVAADEAKFMHDDDAIVGVVFEDVPYAYSYAALYGAPAIVQADHDKRMLLMWSWLANRAVAVNIDHDLKARDLDVVSMPTGALLLYNSRLGQFVNGLTGKTPTDQEPAGFRASLPTTKTTWKDWRTRHPQSRVLAPADRVTFYAQAPPAALPKSLPNDSGVAAATRIVFIATTRPVAVLSSDVKAVVNISAGDERILLFRDPVSGLLRAFDRRLEPDLAPQFALNRDPKRHGFLVDGETNSLWTAAGISVEGDYIPKGHKLRALDVDEDLYWGVMKFWFPTLQLAKPLPIEFAPPDETRVAHPRRPAYHRR